jgi:hypothetical protein
MLFFATGSGTLCLIATVQKIFIGTPINLKGYVIPFIFGGTAGLAIGSSQANLYHQNAKLLEHIEKLQQSNDNLVNVNESLEKRTRQLEKAFAEIKRLQGIIPICAQCKKVQDENGAWRPVEIFVQQHSSAQFSHGLCPDCAKKLYPKLHMVLHGKDSGNQA